MSPFYRTRRECIKPVFLYLELLSKVYSHIPPPPRRLHVYVLIGAAMPWITCPRLRERIA